MARILADGFEWGSNSSNIMWSVQSCQWGSSPPAGFSGNGYVQFLFNNYIGKTFTRDYTDLYISMKIYITGNGTSNSEPMVAFYDYKGTCLATLMHTTPISGGRCYLKAMRGTASGTELATGTKLIHSNTVYLVEIHYKPRDSSGDFEVKVDGNPTLEIDYSGDTTNGLESVRQIGLGSYGGSAYGWCVDDFVVDDSEWIGNVRIEKFYATGAGSSTQWDPSTGANYACVDDYGDTDYISTDVSGEIDTYACSNLSATTGSIAAVHLYPRIACVGTPNAKYPKVAIRTNSTNYSGEALVPQIDVSPKQAIWQTNPNTSAVWVSGEIDALEIGMVA